MHRPSRDPLNLPATPTWSPESRQLHDHLLGVLSHTPSGSRADAVRRCASDLSADLDAGRSLPSRRKRSSPNSSRSVRLLRANQPSDRVRRLLDLRFALRAAQLHRVDDAMLQVIIEQP